MKSEPGPNVREPLPEPFLREAARVLRALAHPKRMRLAEILMERPRPVGELAELCGLPQPQTSHHLRLLQRHGLLADERRGSQVYYRVSEPMVGTILDCMRARLKASSSLRSSNAH